MKTYLVPSTNKENIFGKNEHAQYIKKLSVLKSNGNKSATRFVDHLGLTKEETAYSNDNATYKHKIYKDGFQVKTERKEIIAIDSDKTKKLVILCDQNNKETKYENIYERQENGFFRLTQHYVDVLGQLKTKITYDVVPDNADIIFGKKSDQMDRFIEGTGQEMDIIC